MNREERERRFVLDVRRCRDGMYRVALSMMRAPQDAEDAVSMAVEAAWAHLERMRDMEALPGYLMRCAVNSCHQIMRRKRRETSVEALSETLPATEASSQVWEYLNGLPEKYRLPLILRYSEGMRETEIAGILRITRSGVSSRIQRGLRMLKQQMKGEGSAHD